MDDTKTSIFHYGILGMKWGRRKSGRTSSEEHTALRSLQGKQAHELTNVQIRKAAERIQLEKQYKDLTSKPQNKTIKIVKEILANEGRTLATTFVAGVSALAVKYVMDNKESIADKAANLIKIMPKSG